MTPRRRRSWRLLGRRGGDRRGVHARRRVRTGDLGCGFDQGRLRLAGRSRERYVRGGYNVHPMEVESVLADHPDVAAVAVVARPDPVMGEVGVAVVVPRTRGGAARPRVAPGLRPAIGSPDTSCPTGWCWSNRFPSPPWDKVDRRALQHLIW